MIRTTIIILKFQKEVALSVIYQNMNLFVVKTGNHFQTFGQGDTIYRSVA